ncbi:MAG: hypothetical protein DMF51_10090 [Acidobacteria bacterium]|nr:MAG: hypothetical protein DMF51_10090 [Acidobacteriota bacterium]
MGLANPIRSVRRGSSSHGHRGTRGWEAAHPISIVAAVLFGRMGGCSGAGLRRNDGDLGRGLDRRHADGRHGPVAASQNDAGMRRGTFRRGERPQAALAGAGLMSARFTNLALCRRLLAQARPYWPHIATTLVLGLLSTPLALLSPLPLKIAVDSVIGSHPLPRFLESLPWSAAMGSKTAVLALAAGFLVAMALLSQLQGFGMSLLRTYTGEKLVLAFRARLFRQVQLLSLSYHESRGTTDSTYRIQYDALAIQWIAIDGLIPFISAGFALAGMIYVTARIDRQLALVALLISPVLLLISRAYSRRLRGQWHEVHKFESSAMSVVQEVLAAVRVVKAFGQEDREQRRYMRHASKGIWARFRVAFAEGGFGLLVGLTTAVGTYLSQLYGPLQTLSSLTGHLQRSLASAERAFSLLDETPDVAERQDARPISRASGAVAFRSVSFAYDKDHPVLHDVSFEVGPGTRVGIMGATGAGKTTLVGLLTRFYDPTAGQILLDHRPPGARALLDERRREHRLCPPGCQPRRDRRGGEGGERPRVHPQPAPGLREPGW